MDLLFFIKAAIIIYGAVFTFILVKDYLTHRNEFKRGKLVPLSIIGFISDLLDTWGIGSFATCQAGFKFSKSCDDELMPGTLNIAHTLPTILEFLLFLNLIKISGVTLIALIAGAVVGAVFGASIVSKWPAKLVRIALGCALIILAIVLSCKLAHIGPFESTLSPQAIVTQLEKDCITIENSDQWIYNLKHTSSLSKEEQKLYTDPSITKSEIDHVVSELKAKDQTTIPAEELSTAISDNLIYGLEGSKLIIGIIGNTLLGALMTIGVGLYAPCMALVSALGMNVTACFPIMMGSCAFLMPSAGLKFLKAGKYDRKAAVTITLSGLVGVFVAYKVASMLPMDVLTGIIICVMVYTAITFFRSAKNTNTQPSKN
nr:sulfite exporter TauE/SafE family protein [uncultured Sellimonas sp.]